MQYEQLIILQISTNIETKRQREVAKQFFVFM